MSDQRPLPEPRAAVRVVRPGSGASGPGAAPPMPVAPPNSLPPWLDAQSGPVGSAENPTFADSAQAGPGSGGPAQAGPGSAGSGSAGSRARSGSLLTHGATRPGRGDGHSSAHDADLDLTLEQREVRELLHRAVGGLTPRPDALEQLRRAVPRRRQRRRQLAGSAAATVVLCSLGFFALHSAGMSVSSADGPQAGQSYPDGPNGTRPHGGQVSGGPVIAPGGPNPGPPPGVGSSFGGRYGPGHNSASAQPGASGPLQPLPTLTRLPGTSGGAASAGHPSGLPGSPAAAPECARSQLGNGSDTVGAPDAAGVVYGTFQVANVSSSSCTVSLPGVVSVLAVEGTDRSLITVSPHTAGDPAGGLPNPAATPVPVLLAPGRSYLVEFAWVPATGANAPSCASSSSTLTSAAPSSPTGDSAPAPGSPNDATPGTASVPPSVVLGHVPGSGGSVAATAVIGNACAGTVYRTDPLPGG